MLSSPCGSPCGKKAPGALSLKKGQPTAFDITVPLLPYTLAQRSANRLHELDSDSLAFSFSVFPLLLLLFFFFFFSFSFLSSSSFWCQLSYFDLPSSLKSKACLTELPGASVCELGKTVSSCSRGREGVWRVFHPRNHQLRDACLLCLSLESQWCC